MAPFSIGQAFDEDTVSQHQRQALDAAGTVLLDEWFDDVAGILKDGADPRATRMAEELPPSFRLQLTPVLAKQFVLCLSTIVWKLAQPAWTPPVCLAEEVVLFILIERAKAEIELAADNCPVDAALLDFSAFEEAVFEDADVEYLFDPAYDGIEQSPRGRFLGIGSLALKDCFRLYYGGNLGAVHPYCNPGDLPPA